MAIGLIAFGALFALLNAACFLATQITGRFHSCVPLIGAGCMGAGALLLPSLRYYAWVAVFLDAGTLLLLIASPRMARDVWETAWFNLVQEYVGQNGRTTISLRLYSTGAYVLRWDVHRPPGDFGLGGMGNVGTWQREDDAIVLSYGAQRAILLPTQENGLMQSEGFSEFEAIPGLSLAGVEMRPVASSASG